MTTYEAISLMVMFSMFVVTLVSLIVVLIRDAKKGKK
ncbi:MAG: putative holin-like toxin [Ruminiclostridium sp.]|nr:putative holin-like toxin [Ruminiclostridium sp.]